MQKSIMCLVLFALPFGVQAEVSQTIQTGRYTDVQNVPLVEQLNPLKVVISTTIPSELTSVGQAINYMLLRSGYNLADTRVLSDDAVALLRLPLPDVHRTIGPVTLDVALRGLAGDSFELVVDPVHRIIGYELSTRIVRIEQ